MDLGTASSNCGFFEHSGVSPRQRRTTAPAAEAVFEARRSGPAKLLFAVLYPRCAEAGAVGAEAVRLTFHWQSVDIALDDVEGIDVAVGRR